MVDFPRFDVIGQADGTISPQELVVAHRDVNGKVYAFHSPLEQGPVHCDLCEKPGTRVWMEVDE